MNVVRKWAMLQAMQSECNLFGGSRLEDQQQTIIELCKAEVGALGKPGRMWQSYGSYSTAKNL